MSVEKKILEELSRYNRINKYIMEQEAIPPPPPGDIPPPPPAEPEGAIAPPPIGGEVGPPAEVIDVDADKDVQKIDESSEKLTQTWNTISTKLYEQSQTEQTTDNTESNSNDEVDDVDFEEVS